MSVEKPTNLAASVRARLKNLADRQGYDFQYVLTRYGIERFLYRLAASAYAERFILKGAALFTAWEGEPHRATRDLDLLGHGAHEPDTLVEVFQQILLTPVEPDGLTFVPEKTQGQIIKEGQRYEGVRLHLLAHLGNARVPVQVDVGFGDPVQPQMRTFPTLLDFPAPRLRLYPPETVVAEKLQALVVLGLLNGRLKDFYDLWYLARNGSFDGETLGRAIQSTFEARTTAIPEELPSGLTQSFAEEPGKVQMWAGFLRKAGIRTATPPLSEVLEEIRQFLWPLLQEVRSEGRFEASWHPGGPWITGRSGS